MNILHNDLYKTCKEPMDRSRSYCLILKLQVTTDLISDNILHNDLYKTCKEPMDISRSYCLILKLQVTID